VKSSRWKLRWCLLFVAFAAMGWHTNIADAHSTAARAPNRTLAA
jgi:hypothetical protein